METRTMGRRRDKEKVEKKISIYLTFGIMSEISHGLFSSSLSNFFLFPWLFLCSAPSLLSQTPPKCHLLSKASPWRMSLHSSVTHTT